MATTLETLLANTDGSDLYVLDRAGLAELTKEIFRNVNNRIQERIVDSLDENSDENHVPNANIVYNAVKSLTKVKNLVITSGIITEAHVAPDPTTLYVVRKSSTDTNAVVYIYIDGVGYVSCGGTNTSVDAGDITVNAIPSNVISEIVSTSYQETDPGINGTTEAESGDATEGE